MIRLALLIAAIAAAAVALWPDPQPAPPTATARSTTPRPTATSAPAATTTTRDTLSPAAIDQQDRLTHAQARAERRRHRDRRLIQLLPFNLDGVAVDVSGLAPDGRTILTVVGDHRGLPHARDVYHRILRRAGDTGHVYRPVFRR